MIRRGWEGELISRTFHRRSSLDERDCRSRSMTKKKKKKKKKWEWGRGGTNFANPPPEEFAWWTRLQVPFTDRQVNSGERLSKRHVVSIMVRAEHDKYTYNVKLKWCLWNSIRGYQRPAINGFVSLIKNSTNERINYKIINDIQQHC